jgi:hypothetical protein
MFIRRISSRLLLLLSVFFIANAHAECVATSIGQVFCSPPNGGITINSIGQVLCGPGQCVTNSIGQTLCSSQPGGGATINPLGGIVCVGGCVPGNPSLCQSPR